MLPPQLQGLALQLLLLLRASATTANLPQVIFSTVEELPQGSLIGNLSDKVPSSVHLSSSDEAASSFGLLPSKSDRSSGAGYLELDARGILSVKRRIDRDSMERCERLQPCQLAVQAFRISGGKAALLQTIIDVRVNVLDINDNEPAWSQHILEVALNEDHPVGEAFKVEAAKDPDFGPNGTISYELLDPSDTFYLDRVSSQQELEIISIVLKRQLDREVVERYNLTLVARDAADEPRSTSIKLLVRVEDTNDNKPTFNQSHYSAAIPETTSSGSLILQLHATDLDKGRNGEVEYSFAEVVPYQVSAYFRLDAGQGKLFLRQALDYDVAGTRRFEFGVAARDRAPIPKLSVAQVVIDVLDENDCSPVLTVYQFSARDMRETSKLVVPEDTEPESLLGIASVNDNDSGAGGEAECDIQPPLGNLLKLIQLPDKLDSRQKTYRIVNRERFDRETQESYQVTFLCYDRGVPSLTSSYTILVDIQDVNDESPVFAHRQYEFSVRENIPALSYVGSVAATDRDAMQNGQVSYDIDANSLDARLFCVSVTGKVQTTAPLDREQKDLLKFVVIARDHGTPALKASASVVVRVLDDNDSEPRFGQTSYAFEIFENETPDSVVSNLTAWDDDAGNNAKLTFSILPYGVQSVPFRVVTLYEGLAQIRTTGMVDRESERLLGPEERSYMFSVLAKDRGARPQTGSCMVKVVIRDRNDNSPKWIVPSGQLWAVNVSRDADIGQPFIHVKAVDLDDGEFGKIRYSIWDGDPDGLFALDPSDGGLQLRRQPRHTRRYVLNLVAADCAGCNVSHRTYSSLTVNVIDQPKDVRSERRGDRPGGKRAAEMSHERIIVWLVSCTAVIALLTICGILVAKCLLARLSRADAAATLADKRQQQLRTAAHRDTLGSRQRESLLFPEPSLQQRDHFLGAVPREPAPPELGLTTDPDEGGAGGGGGCGAGCSKVGGGCIDGSCEAKKTGSSNAYQGVVSTLSSRAWHPGESLMQPSQSQHRQQPQPRQQYTTLVPARRQQQQQHQSAVYQAGTAPHHCGGICGQQPLAARSLRAQEDPAGSGGGRSRSHLIYQTSSFV